MSYTTISQCAKDHELLVRVQACISTQPTAPSPPYELAEAMIWQVSSRSDIEAAYASALAAHNPNPGGDPAVITDQMILSAVQAEWPKPPTP